MTQEEFTAIAPTIPLQPGVYRYYNAENELLYVGKAKQLRKRISSYFNKQLQHYKTVELVRRIHHIEFTIVNNEQDAFLLENSLIKNYQPIFNINLKDSTAVLDSFKLVKVDTITQKMLLFEQVSVLNNQLDYLLDIYKLTNQKMSNSIDQMRLYGMLNSKTFVDIEKNDFDKVSEKSKEIKAELDTVSRPKIG